MTSQQIKEAAEREVYDIEIVPSNWGQPQMEVRHRNRDKEEAYISGYHAALKSDTVKGMVDALEYVKLNLMKNFDLNEKGETITVINAALNNYNESIKSV